MPFPAGVETVTVTTAEPLTLPDGTFMQGRILFTAPDVVTAADDGYVFGGTVTAELVDGILSVELVATDATGINPSGWTYKVDSRFSNGSNWTRYIELPLAAPVVDLADILVADPVEGEYTTLVVDKRRTAYKTADQDSTDTTLQDDTHLSVTVEADSVYKFEANLVAQGTEAADLQIAFSGPADAVAAWAPGGATLSVAGPDGQGNIKMAAKGLGDGDATAVGILAAPGQVITPSGHLITGPTPGSLTLRWAQNADTGTTTLRKGSWLELIRLSGPGGGGAPGPDADFPRNYPSDQSLLAWTYDPDMAGHVTAQSAAGVAGRVTLTKIRIRRTITWSKIWFGLSGIDAGASLADCYLGVYDEDGNRVGVTADISSALMTNAVAKAVDLVTPFTASPGEYYVAMLLNGTWATNGLTFKASGAGISVNANLAVPRLRYSNMLTGQTSLPASLDLTQQSTSAINTGWASQWYGIS